MLPDLADPRDLGLDGDRLALMDAFVRERYLDTGRLPHAQLLVARGGRIAHFSYQGTAREDGTPVGPDSLYRIASMTKPVTSVAFMQLVEDGRVALDDPVGSVLPELADTPVYAGGGAGAPFVTRPAGEPIRMIDLLRHTAGFTYSFQNRTNVDAAYRERRIESWHGNHDLDSFVAELGQIPIEFTPGTRWNYSVATDVLGAAVQRIADKPLAEVLHERIFGPLGMDDTFFQVPADKLHRLTDCYTHVPAKGRVMYDPGAASAWARAPRLVSGGGGLVSSALDYHRFCAMLLAGGTLDGARVIGRKTIALMTQNHLPGGGDLASMSQSMFSEATNSGVGFGLGFAVTTDVARTLVPGSVGDFYWGGLFSTAFLIDPIERLHMIFMTQLSPSNLYPIRRELKTMLHAALN